MNAAIPALMFILFSLQVRIREVTFTEKVAYQWLGNLPDS